MIELIHQFAFVDLNAAAPISTWLIAQTSDKAAPGMWMGFGGACGLSATFAIYRGRNVPPNRRSPGILEP